MSNQNKVKSNIRTMELIQIDFWGRPTYRCIETNMLWKDITLGKKEPELYSCGNSIEGEPDYPINPKLKIVFRSKYTEDINTFNYQMLDRLRTDCNYYLGYGYRNPNVLYYKNEKEHINQMKDLYNKLPKNGKPAWLTWEQILQYEKLMIGG